MAEDEGKTGGDDGEGDKGKDKFDPKSLSPEALEYMRREVQSESDSKAQLVETRLRAEQATRARGAVETAEQNELKQLADSGQHEALGQRVAARLTQRSAEETAVMAASDLIEKQMADKFSETLGPERVEQIRREVIQQGGAHAEFAEGLAKASGGEDRQEEIAAEVKAALIEAGVVKRDEAAGPDKITGKGQGNPPSTFDEIEKAYIAGTLPGGREAYIEAKKAK
jgi:hypothetical protein